MLRETDKYFLLEDEPAKSTMLFLRDFILTYNPHITEAWKYRMPFYFYKGERFCYLHTNAKTKQPYIGFTDGKILEHPKLVAENRARMKIMLINPLQDMPVGDIGKVIDMVIALRERWA